MISSRSFPSSLLAALLATAASASAQQVTMPLWTHGPPEPSQTKGPERDTSVASDSLVAGRPVVRLTDVSEPTLAVYMPAQPTTNPAQPAASTQGRPAVVVFPGGGYKILAFDLEGTEVCHWLNSLQVTCVLVKYRVPYEGHFPERSEDLEDAQQAMRLTRTHAAQWGIDPKRVGALGFSAGAHLAAVLSIHSDFQPKASAALQDHGGVNASINARPDFAFILYPGYLVHWPEKTIIAPEIVPTATTPPTFLLQAEDDPVHVENVLVYFQALKEAKVPAELHVFAQGGHGYGLRASPLPITHWPALAETWLRTLHILDPP